MSPPASNMDTKFYCKSTQGLHGAVNLDVHTARVFAVIDGNTPMSKIAEIAGVSMALLWQAIAKLTRLGLIEGAGRDGGFMGKLFVDVMQNEFAKAVGPIGNILLTRVAARNDISLPNIPVDRASELINKLANEIPDQKARTEFQHKLLNDI
jgi:hypothetical protein